MNELPSFNYNLDYNKLSQKWKESEADLVTDNQSVDQNDNLKSKENYNLGETVAKINQLQQEGKKICLFIGRTPYEKLPSDNGEAKVNEFWLSADLTLKSTEGHEELKDSPGIENRPFIWLDFNHQEGLELIHGLFDKVVIDNSTTKSLEDDFAKRFAVLLRDSDSELIFSDPSTSTLDPNQEEVEQFNSSNYCTLFSEDIFDESEDYKETFLKMDNHALENTKSHLEELYSKVDLYRNTNFPYFNNYSRNDSGESFYIVRNFKKII